MIENNSNNGAIRYNRLSGSNIKINNNGTQTGRIGPTGTTPIVRNSTVFDSLTDK